MKRLYVTFLVGMLMAMLGYDMFRSFKECGIVITAVILFNLVIEDKKC